MKRALGVFALIMFTVIVTASIAVAQEDVRTKVEEIGGQVGGHDEAIKELQNDVSALKKIKVSGYLQAQFEKSEKAGGFVADPYDANDPVKSRFNLRRSRIKVAYDAGSTQMVVQGDFSNAGFSLKDAYLDFSEPTFPMLSARIGVFNRPNYEVEYSSSQRESPERSSVVRALYPNERDLGVMLTLAPEDLFVLQLAGFNNTFLGPIRQTSPNFGSEPLYFMARLTKSLTLGDIGLDLGVHGRFGNVRANTGRFITAENPTTLVDTTGAAGDAYARSWFGVEAQLYYDFLGGMKILGEYITGSDVNELSAAGASPVRPVRQREFSGFYVMLVKNIGADWQFAAKYDSYMPNTAIGDDKVNQTSELAVSTIGVGLHNYTFANVRLTVWYDMISTATNDRILKEDPKDNQLTLRAQYKF
jgi:hypothetical protein